MQFGPGVLPTFLYYFTATAVIVGFVTIKGLHFGADTGVPQVMGTIAGLIAGSLGTYRNRTTTLQLPVQSKKKFMNQLESTLNQMGYQKTAEEDEVLTFERSAGTLSPSKIYVQLEGETVTIASRARILRQVKQALEPSDGQS
ncbi:hypothetical protein [Leptolyngbya ohadii]|uniref:hypothetical protein n=1 Tax=Leptolyngbya ohadii TaxID=1962290 RepID=UPI001179AFC8|nr:hypothetical protein [Leptolyngbya ohadii]